MNSNERVHAAIHYRTPDKIPVEYLYSKVGYYEHGDKLNTLYAAMPGDFGPYERMPVCAPKPEELDSDGNYHAFQRDEWGTLWEYRIFGIAGIPAEYPLADAGKIAGYKLPAPADLSVKGLEEQKKWADGYRKQFYLGYQAGNLYERLIALRPEVDVMCDMEIDEPEINLLADRITERNLSFVECAVRIRADGIRFGDDYGSERSLLMSPKTWRRFIKPRLRETFAPAVKAGLDIHFHSCGQVDAILDDLTEIGVNSIWPQLPAYDMPYLSKRCRSLGLAIAIHTDRAQTMTYGTPQQVRDLVLRECDTFRMHEGGSWYYIEADNGFPYANIEALVKTVAEIR